MSRPTLKAGASATQSGMQHPGVAVGPVIGGQLTKRVPRPEGGGQIGPATTQPIREAGPGEVLAAPARVFVGCFCWRRFSGKPAPIRRIK